MGTLGKPSAVGHVDPIFARKAPRLALIKEVPLLNSGGITLSFPSVVPARQHHSSTSWKWRLGPHPDLLRRTLPLTTSPGASCTLTCQRGAPRAGSRLTFVLLEGLLGGLQHRLVELMCKLLCHEGLPRLALPVDAVGQGHGNVLGGGAPDVMHHAQVLLAPRGLIQPGLLAAGRSQLLDSRQFLWPELLQSPRLCGLWDVRQGSSNTHRLFHIQRGWLRGWFF